MADAIRPQLLNDARNMQAQSPTLSAVKALPDAIGIGASALQEETTKDFRNKRAFGLAEKAKEFGLDPQKYATIAEQGDYATGLEMLITDATKRMDEQQWGDMSNEISGFAKTWEEKYREQAMQLPEGKERQAFLSKKQQAFAQAQNEFISGKQQSSASEKLYDQWGKRRASMSAYGTENSASARQTKKIEMSNIKTLQGIGKEIRKDLSMAEKVDTQISNAVSADNISKIAKQAVAYAKKYSGGKSDIFGTETPTLFALPGGLGPGLRDGMTAVMDMTSSAWDSAKGMYVQTSNTMMDALARFKGLTPEERNTVERAAKSMSISDISDPAITKNKKVASALKSAVLMSIWEMLKRMSGAAVSDGERAAYLETLDGKNIGTVVQNISKEWQLQEAKLDRARQIAAQQYRERGTYWAQQSEGTMDEYTRTLESMSAPLANEYRTVMSPKLLQELMDMDADPATESEKPAPANAPTQKPSAPKPTAVKSGKSAGAKRPVRKPGESTPAYRDRVTKWKNS